MNILKEVMQRVSVTGQDVKDRMRWRQMIHCGILTNHACVNK